MQFRGIFGHPVILPLVIAFFVLNLAVTEYGGTNAKSRNAALRAMSESHTFAITRYKDWTIDWAQTPDGQYYSNKAPGPMLLGFPLYWPLDQISKLFDNGWRDEFGRRTEPPYWFHVIFIFILQVIPFAILSAWASTNLANRGASPSAIAFFLLAAFFANTAAVFMNSNFGHGLAAVLVLGLFLVLQARQAWLAGLLTGFAIVSDYGVIVQLPAILAAAAMVFWSRERLRSLFLYALGVIPGAVLWCWYHISAFGSAFALPNKFQNPDFVDLKHVSYNLWGVISLPNATILAELLWGPSRGVWFTQPYVFLGAAMLPFIYWLWPEKRDKVWEEHTLAIFALGGFLGLLFMNAGFGGWHGGHSPGPRYMSAIFPLVALLIAFWWDRLPRFLRGCFWGTLAASLFFRAMVYAHGVLVPPEPVWPFLWKFLINVERSKTPLLRVAIFFIVIGLCLFWAWRRTRRFYALNAPLSSQSTQK